MKRLIALILLTLTLTMCAACQPTPEKPAVQSKGDGTLEQRIAAASQEFVSDDITVKEEFESKTPKVTICVDAKVDMPDEIKALPVVEGEKGEFTNEFLQAFLEAVGEGHEYYDPVTDKTKTQIQEELKELESHMTEEYLNEYYNGDADMIAYAKKEFEKQHEALVEVYKKSPDTITRKKSDMELKPSAYYVSSAERDIIIKEMKEHLGKDRADAFLNNSDSYHGIAYLDDGYMIGVSVKMYDNKTRHNYALNYICGKYLSDSDFMPTYKVEDTSCTIDDETAVRIADEFVKRAGFTEFALSEYEKVMCGRAADIPLYRIVYRRTINSVVSNEVPEGYAENRPTYQDEHIEMQIADEGVINFIYTNPIAIGRTINEGVGVKDFDEVYEIYKEQAALTYDNVYGREESLENENEIIDLRSERAVVSIDSIKLRYIRIAEKDKQLTYLYVPAYVFSGSETFTNGETMMNSRDVEMIVNAIDGSIISAEDCY